MIYNIGFSFSKNQNPFYDDMNLKRKFLRLIMAILDIITTILDMIFVHSEKYNQAELTVHKIPHELEECNWDDGEGDEHKDHSRNFEDEQVFVHPFYAKELDSEAEFNAGFKDEIRYRFNENKVFDDCNWEIEHAESELEIPDEYEEFNWKNECDDEGMNRELKVNAKISYQELMAKISSVQRKKHFWPEGNVEKQVEWNSNLTKALELYWRESFDETVTQLRFPIVVSSLRESAEILR